MTTLKDEIETNYRAFFSDWTTQAAKNWAKLSNQPHYAESYRRLCCLQTIKNELVIPNFSEASAAFFFEGHNDALTSHVSASLGAWRSALQALRSCLENTVCSIYYKDHPVELELWTSGKFRIGFSELEKYLTQHPRLGSLDPAVSGLQTIGEEYATLSKAVHASAQNFRMTDAARSVLLWSDDVPRVGMWACREQKVLEGISLLMTALYSEQLQGTKLTSLRSMLFFTIPPKKRKDVKSCLGVSISSP
jgi:hypothetical protein